MVLLALFRLGDKIKSYIREDFSFLAFRKIEFPAPGLYTYRIELPDGRKARLHLRVDPQRNGALFVDVTDIYHLNSTALLIVKLALDGAPLRRAAALLLSQYALEDKKNILSQLEDIYRMIALIREQPATCVPCEMGSLFEVKPLFEVPISAPYKVDIALTYGCNDQCPHCYNEVNRFVMPSLPLTDWQKVLDKLCDIGVPHIIITGGEPTLHPDLPDIIRYADNLGMIVGMNSNGRRLAHPPYMQALADAGLNHVQITLGSNYPHIHNAMMGSDSFEQRIQGVQNALSSGVHTITNTTLLRGTMNHVDEFIDYIFNLGIRTFAMNGMIYSGGGFNNPNAIPEDELPVLLARVKDYSLAKGMRFLWYTVTEYCRLSPIELDIGVKRCNAGEYSMCIEPNGDVLPCQSYYVSAGNILKDSWETIWQHDLFRSFREREENPQFGGLEAKCYDCPDLPLCAGGCRIEREARQGVRVGTAGGSCFGCGAGWGADKEDHERYEPKGGFIPLPGQTDKRVRATGAMPLLTLGENDAKRRRRG